ncbi:MAG: hypothetical protein V7607_1207 [Solirubrobacteraceae bacterium]
MTGLVVMLAILTPVLAPGFVMARSNDKRDRGEL